MRDWVNDDYSVDEEELVNINNRLDSSDDAKQHDARKRLERMLEDRRLREDIDDYH